MISQCQLRHSDIFHWIIILLLFIFFLSVPSHASNKKGLYDITGNVFDELSSESLPYANVVLVGTDRGTVTNVNGFFVIVDVPEGEYTLRVTFIGYKNSELSITNNGLLEPIQVEMTQEAINMGQVEVVAQNYKIWEKAENTSQITLSPKQLDILPNFGDVDIFRSLQMMPGISGANDGSSGLYVRGGTPDQNMVILDGMTVYHVDHFFGMFSAFNADAIKDVQVYKGGFPAKYGGRLSSVVDLTGKNGDQNLTEFSANINLLSAGACFETPLMNNASLIITARRSYTDVIRSPLYNSIFDFVTQDDESGTPQMPMSGGGPGGGMFNTELEPSFYFYDINSKLSWAPTHKDVLNLSFYNGKDKLDESRDMQNMIMRGNNTQDIGTRVDNNVTDWGNLGGSFKWARQWRDRFHTNMLVAYSNYNSSHERELSFNSGNTVTVTDSNRVIGLNGSFTNEYNDVKDMTFRLDAEWNVRQNHKLGFGTFISGIQTAYQTGVGDSMFVLDMDSQSLQSSVYLQDEWKIYKTVNVTLGLRSTYLDVTQSLYTAPRLSFQWMLTDKLSLKGAWGHYYQFINNITNENVLEGSHDFWLSADKNLEPSFSVHEILGISYETGNYLFEIEGYYKTLDNLVEYSRRYGVDADYLNYFYFGSGISKGIEFLVQKKMGQFNGWISYTLGSVDYTFDRINYGESFPAAHDRTHEFKAIGSYQWGPWSFGATWIFGTGQPYTAPESQYYLTLLDGEPYSYFHVGDKNAYRLPDYHRMDISVSRRFESAYYNWHVGLSVFNVYNHDNVYYRNYDLDTAPILVSDVMMLGFTPTVFIKINRK